MNENQNSAENNEANNAQPNIENTNNNIQPGLVEQNNTFPAPVQEEIKIEFHDEEIASGIEANKKGKKNIIALICFAISILTIVFSLVNENTSLEFIESIGMVSSIILGIIALIQIKKKNETGKVFAIIGLLLPIIIILISIVTTIFLLNGNGEAVNEMKCAMTVDCDDNGDGTSKCIDPFDEYDITCDNKILDQVGIEH